MGRTQHFLAGTGQFASHRAGSHHSGNADNFIEGDVTVVLDVLDLLTIAWWFLQGLYDQGSSRWDNRDGSLSVLDGQAHGDLQTLPVSSGLGNVVTDLLGGL